MSLKSFTLDFQSFPAHQTATFLAVLASTILRSDVVRLPTLCSINWISVCRASFRQVTAPIGAIRLLLFHAYFSVHQYVKEQFFHVRSLKLSSDARLSLPERPTLQGMWTYLCAFRENLPKGTKKSVTEVRLKLTTLWLGPRCSIPLSYSAKLG